MVLEVVISYIQSSHSKWISDVVGFFTTSVRHEVEPLFISETSQKCLGSPHSASSLKQGRHRAYGIRDGGLESTEALDLRTG